MATRHTRDLDRHELGSPPRLIMLSEASHRFFQRHGYQADLRIDGSRLWLLGVPLTLHEVGDEWMVEREAFERFMAGQEPN